MATGYIIQPWDFSVVQSVNVTDYDLPLECYSGETGSVTFEGKGTQNFSQYIFRFESLDTMWKIREAETGDALSTKLSVTDATGILDSVAIHPIFRNSRYTDTIDLEMLKTLCGYNNSTIGGNWDEQRHRFIYRYVQPRINDNMSSLLTSAALKTADYLMETFVQGGQDRFVVVDLYKLASDLINAGASMSLTIGSRNMPAPYGGRALLPSFSDGGVFGSVAVPIYFNDGHSFLLTESYDDDVCSCFVGMSKSSPIMPTSNYTYYLDKNMSMTQNKSDQINGYTKYETCTDAADATSKAQAVFGQNQWKHKVEFASDKIFHLNQPVRLMLERGILNTAISKVTIKSKDDRYYYTCGDLPQTAAQHIKANSWSYGSRLPHNPYAGQLAFI
jgi:hypothetical protein